MKLDMGGEMKAAAGIPLMCEVVSTMRTETVVCEVGILRSGGGWAIVRIRNGG